MLKWRVHPLWLPLSPLVLMVGAIRTPSFWFLAIVTGAMLAINLLGGLKRGILAALRLVLVFLFIWGSFSLWIPQENALMLAGRMATLAVVVLVPYLSIRWEVAADTLTEQFKVPYPLVDTIGMAGRFVAMMRREWREMSLQQRVNARGSRITQLRQAHRMVVPLLVASFRHAETTALALEARRFGAAETRTTHYTRRVTAFDVILLLGYWAASGWLIWATGGLN